MTCGFLLRKVMMLFVAAKKRRTGLTFVVAGTGTQPAGSSRRQSGLVL